MDDFERRCYEREAALMESSPLVDKAMREAMADAFWAALRTLDGREPPKPSRPRLTVLRGGRR